MKQFYLRTFASPYSACLLALGLLFTACSKDDTANTPEYGYVQIGSGAGIKFNVANETADGAYILTNQGAQNDVLVSVTAQLPARPNATQAFTLTSDTYITYVQQKDGKPTATTYFGAPGESITTDLVNGKVKLSLKNLTEVDSKHQPVAGSTLVLSGELSGR
jgi:hypothetical protein